MQTLSQSPKYFTNKILHFWTNHSAILFKEAYDDIVTWAQKTWACVLSSAEWGTCWASYFKFLDSKNIIYLKKISDQIMWHTIFDQAYKDFEKSAGQYFKFTKQE